MGSCGHDPAEKGPSPGPAGSAKTRRFGHCPAPGRRGGEVGPASTARTRSTSRSGRASVAARPPTCSNTYREWVTKRYKTFLAASEEENGDGKKRVGTN